MSYVNQNKGSQRIKSLVAVIVIHAVLGYALVSGTGVDISSAVSDGFKVIALSPEPPPEPVREPAPKKAEAKEAEGAASAENLKAKPTQIVAPKPKVKLKVKSPVRAAPKPGPGNDATAGASDRKGPGFGAGGAGDGTGSGRGGDGSGGGGMVSGPAHKSGAITRKDIPRAVWKSGVGGTVVARFMVEPDGRATACEIRQSSGYAELDNETCRLLTTRFRFEPARDAQGKGIRAAYGWRQDWWHGRRKN
ncbi:energy transducer TonB [Parasphingorhabdus halotolerans]|uniref:TonB family protein n=1 Tax=Parasphingorhabdus halotolerans TaxID=2725558 RepID=A0A6H2DP67_9SPHN|nr:TonB family protein [Parasphingorhabdus halotolerans]QJB69551.1 TonB family protein [Parasphingorhabdus halotolerans]